MENKPSEFLVFGRVFDPSDQQGLAGLTVEALDKDLLLDDRLGSTTTDGEGRFALRYDREDFQGLFFEAKPDLYLQVKNAQGDIVHTSKEKVRHHAAAVEEFSIAIAKHQAERSLIEYTRSNFKTLVSINPNYFGTAPKVVASGELAFNAVASQSQNTKYEELRCVGLNPAEDLLEAIFEVKLPYGFRHRLCGEGSKEYVAFYIDYNDGAGWISAGAPTQVTVHDLAFVHEHHLFYAVRSAFSPKQILPCGQPQILRVRAILSWENIPTGPSFNPVWGNVKEVWVQIRPKRRAIMAPLVVGDLNAQLKLASPLAPSTPIPFPDPHPQVTISGDLASIQETIELTTKALEAEQKSSQVEPQRLEFASLIEKNPNYFGSISMASEAENFAEDIGKLSPYAVQYLTSKYTIDPKLLTPVFPHNPKTKYEELTCLGLCPEEDLIEATIRVKLPYGFNGNLCTLGSWEYVAFYIDWGAGWEYVETARLHVHNLNAGDHQLSYAVKAQLKNVEDRLKSCETENVVKVRAILSWNHDPTLYGPSYKPAWGNALDRYVQIRPSTGTSARCYLDVVNLLNINHIAQSGVSRGLAYDTQDLVPPLTFNRPFGGLIAAWGNVNIPGAVHYRFRVSEDNGITWTPVQDTRIACGSSIFSPIIQRKPDADGWFSIADYNIDKSNYFMVPLVHWASYGKNGSCVLQLQLGDGTKTPMPGQTAEVVLQLDNRSIDLYTFKDAPSNLPASGVVVKDTAGNFKKCDSYKGMDAIKVFANFRDDYFAAFNVSVAGGNIVGAHPIASGDFRTPLAGVFNEQGIIAAANDGVGAQIASFNLCAVPQTPGKVKCAYVVILEVSDRSIVGYLDGYAFNTTAHYVNAYVTFDWDPNGAC